MNRPVSVKFKEEQLAMLNIERARLDRSINWIIREAVKRYFIMVENELNVIKLRNKNK